MAAQVEDKVYRLPFKVVTGATWTPPAGTLIAAVVPCGVSATFKAKGFAGGDDHASNGVYATGSAVEMFAADLALYSEVTVSAGTAKVYYGAL
jgi:hypothetical protein